MNGPSKKMRKMDIIKKYIMVFLGILTSINTNCRKMENNQNTVYLTHTNFDKIREYVEINGDQLKDGYLVYQFSNIEVLLRPKEYLHIQPIDVKKDWHEHSDYQFVVTKFEGKLKWAYHV